MKRKRSGTALPSRAPPAQVLPLVSIIIPVHNGLVPVATPPSASTSADAELASSSETWLDACLSSVLRQTYDGPLEVSIFDDASDDGSGAAIRAWGARLQEAGVSVALSGSRWAATTQPARKDVAAAAAPAGGIGVAKNRAVQQSSGEYLCFLDVDDVLLSSRVVRQLAASRAHPRAIVGGGFVREPRDSTAHHAAWANGMSPAQLWLQQFRETTVLMPTWFMPRSLYDAVGGFREAPPHSGEAEDLRFFHAHLDLHGAENVAAGVPSLIRVGDAASPLLLYRWSADSGTSRVTRRQLIAIRAAAFERRILDKAWAGRRFSVWGAGRDAKHFIAALSVASRARIAVLLEIAPKKIGTTYVNGSLTPTVKIPIVHFKEAAKGGAAVHGGAVVVCVSLRRGSEQQGGALETNVATLGLVEGESLWYFN